MREGQGLSDEAIRHLRDTIDRPDAGERFDVRALLGEGGMGRVYSVYDRVLAREVALKVLALEAETPDLATRLAREARVLAQLEHPGIAAVHDAGTLEDGRPYYLMRLVRGSTLAASSVTSSRGERLRQFLRVCDAVAFAHARRIVHRDLKPSNIMIGEYGEVVVLDWGVAKVLADQHASDVSTEQPRSHVPLLADATHDGFAVGTPGFMSPEQAEGAPQRVDRRSDVFGLGALLHYLLDLETDRPVPKPLAAVIARATASAPDARYQQVEQLADDVRRWLDGEPVVAYRESLVERIGRAYDKNKTLILLLAAYAVVRVTILLWRGV